MSITGGRFLAPFLEHEAGFSDTWIGITLSVQYAILSLLAPVYGKLADSLEKKRPHYGRGKVLSAGVLGGTLSFLLHGMNFIWNHSFFDSLYYHFVVSVTRRSPLFSIVLQNKEIHCLFFSFLFFPNRFKSSMH